MIYCQKIRWIKKVGLKNARVLDRGGHIEVVYLFGLILIDLFAKLFVNLDVFAKINILKLDYLNLLGVIYWPKNRWTKKSRVEKCTRTGRRRIY